MRIGVIMLVALIARSIPAQTACPVANLPAYSHNDYLNRRPLADALELGFRGVEADVFLVGDSLRVGHDRRAAARAGTLHAVYLDPLRELATRCGPIGRPDKPFLFTVELKDRSAEARSALTGALARFDSARPANVVVVVVPDPDPRLMSVDYGKTIGRWWVSRARRARRLEEIRKQKAAAPGVLFRVHNVPVERRLYDALLGAGVDLIGTKDLIATHRLLGTR
jgi:hypothetical protein